MLDVPKRDMQGVSSYMEQTTGGLKDLLALNEAEWAGESRELCSSLH